MNAVDGSDHFEKPSQEQAPSLLTVILDTNPAAWSLLSSTLPLSSAVANLLVFINAHLAANYTNKVAVIASHCDKATWLYPSPTEQILPRSLAGGKRQSGQQDADPSSAQDDSSSSKRLKPNGSSSTNIKLNLKPPSSPQTGNKYRPFRLVEEELLQNLTVLLSSTTPESISTSTSTMIAGALTLALSHINRETILQTESVMGGASAINQTSATASGGAALGDAAAEGGGATQGLQSRILLISASPSTDLAHQYIPIMNAIFACQRLGIPIDILQLPLPSASASSSSSSSSTTPTHSNSTVFLQQASDATHGIFIPAQLTAPSSSSSSSSSLQKTASQSLLTYLLTSFLPSPSTRSAHLILPTRIDVDFRAACFCHRNVVSTGFVCSICLSIFCSIPENGDCLTCGTHLTVAGYGARPVVVVGGGGAKKVKRKQQQQQQQQIAAR